MVAYVIVDLDVIDPDAYRGYTAAVPASLTAFGGRFVVRGGRYETLEGEWSPQHIGIFEFPTYEQAKSWHESPDYQAILPIRLQNSRANFLTIVEGV